MHNPNQQNIDYHNILIKINDRMLNDKTPRITITENDLKNYEKDKEYLIKLHYDEEKYEKFNNVNFDVWDISFASQYGFPNNRLSFNNQWFLKKIEKFIPFLQDIKKIENTHICYKPIKETNITNLNELCDLTKNYFGRRCSGNGKDFNEEEYKKECLTWVKEENDIESNYQHKKSLYEKYEKNPISHIFPYYNNITIKSMENIELNYDIDFYYNAELMESVNKLQSDYISFKFGENEEIIKVIKHLTNLLNNKLRAGDAPGLFRLCRRRTCKGSCACKGPSSGPCSYSSPGAYSDSCSEGSPGASCGRH